MKLPFGFRLIRVSSGEEVFVAQSPAMMNIWPARKPKATRKARPICKNGHKKNGVNTIFVGGQSRCRICYVAELNRRKIEREIERAAKVGQK